MALRTQCKGIAEEGSGCININVLKMKMIMIIAFQAGPRKVGESCCTVWMADRTLAQNRLEVLYSMFQVRDPIASHVFGESYMARICVSTNFAVYGVL
jgi:hypothetical protein